MPTNLTHGRGWLTAEAAASVHRIDRQLGRPADINEAGRSAAKADANYRRWLAYLAGGPKAPYALPASESVHCVGEAADSDDWYDAQAAAVWRDNGWRQTALYPNNPKKHEPWHGEYFINLDRRRNDPAALTETPEQEEEEEEEEMALKGATYKDSTGKDIYLLFNEVSGFHVEHSGIPSGEYNNPIAAAWATGSWPKITEGHAKVIKRSLNAILRTAVSGSLSVDLSGME